MKIEYLNDPEIKFENIKIGEIFKKDGKIFIKTEDAIRYQGCDGTPTSTTVVPEIIGYICVDLSNGHCHSVFDYDCVYPIDGVLKINECNFGVC